MTKIDQDTPQEKKGNKDDMPGQKANKQKPMQTEVETQQVVGCKIRFLVGYENERTFTTITTTKKEVDSQFWYPGRNTVINKYTHQG